MKGYQVARLLAYVTGLVNQELLLQNEYLVTENRILRAQAPSRLRLSDSERATLAEIGKRLGRKGLAKVAQVAKPETIRGWFRQLVAQKFDGSKHRSYPGRPRIDAEVESLIVQMARENSSWVVGCQNSQTELFKPPLTIDTDDEGRRSAIAQPPQSSSWDESLSDDMRVFAYEAICGCDRSDSN